jgi:hypothetical protein
MKARPNREDRRKEPRLLCADLVTVYWLDEIGTRRKSVANLEDVSHCGACLMMDAPISLESEIRIDTGCGHYLGNVRHVAPFDISYLMGIQFLPGCEWDASRFQPAHLFDPRSIAPPDGDSKTPGPQPVSEKMAEDENDLQRLLDVLRSDFA